jgi:hypothetical protein
VAPPPEQQLAAPAGPQWQQEPYAYEGQQDPYAYEQQQQQQLQQQYGQQQPYGQQPYALEPQSPQQGQYYAPPQQQQQQFMPTLPQQQLYAGYPTPAYSAPQQQQPEFATQRYSAPAQYAASYAAERTPVAWSPAVSHFSLTGVLAEPPELRLLPSGKQRAALRLAVRQYDGSSRLFRLEAYGAVAERAAALGPGQMVLLAGELRQRASGGGSAAAAAGANEVGEAPPQQQQQPQPQPQQQAAEHTYLALLVQRVELVDPATVPQGHWPAAPAAVPPPAPRRAIGPGPSARESYSMYAQQGMTLAQVAAARGFQVGWVGGGVGGGGGRGGGGRCGSLPERRRRLPAPAPSLAPPAALPAPPRPPAPSTGCSATRLEPGPPARAPPPLAPPLWHARRQSPAAHPLPTPPRS